MNRSSTLAVLMIGSAMAPAVIAQSATLDIAPAYGPGPVYSSGTPRSQTDGTSLIYTNGPYVSHVAGGFNGLDASVLQNTTLGHTVFGYGCAGVAGATGQIRLADDFTVPAGQMWYVESVKVHAYRTVAANAAPVTFTNGVCRIWDAAPNGVANVVFGDITTNRLVTSTFDNCYRVVEATPLNNQRGVVESVLTVGKLFTPGTYWIEWGVNDATLGSAFAPPITITGQNTTGDALQVNGTTWTTLVNGTGTAGVPFQLCGEVACCWEPNIGASLGLGDDQLSAALTLPFAFRKPGELVGGATTTQIKVCSNGFVWLDGTSTATDFSPTTAEFTSLAARIACPWDDFYTVGGGTVHFASTPYRAIATWRRIDTYNSPNTSITETRTQLQMFPNGTFTINCWYHEPVTLRTPVFGVSAGLNAPSVAIDYSAGHVGTLGTSTIYEGFTSGTSDLSGKTFVFVAKDDGVLASYDVAVLPSCGTPASATLIAPGCFGMTTTVTNRAIAGTNLVLDSVIPVTAAFGLTALGLIPIPGNIPIPGATGCFVHHSNDLGIVPMVIGGGGLTGTTTIALPCLSVFFGLTICSQGAALTTPPLNPLGVVLGDAWLTTLGTDG